MAVADYLIKAPHVPEKKFEREPQTHHTFEQMLALMPEKDRHRIRFLVDAFCQAYRDRNMTVIRRDS